MYKDLLKPNNLVFDVGLNLGDKSEHFLKNGIKLLDLNPLLSVLIMQEKDLLIIPTFLLKISH